MMVESEKPPTTEQRGFRLPAVNIPALLMLVLLVWVAHLFTGRIVAQGQIWLDDWHYGRPRTTHFHGYVGHGESSAPTHFIGLNLERQVVVFELPGGDASQVRMLPGPYLFGQGEELTPVDLALDDMDRDGHVDLIIAVRHEQVIYLNKEGQFRLPNPEEQQMLRLRHGVGSEG